LLQQSIKLICTANLVEQAWLRGCTCFKRQVHIVADEHRLRRTAPPAQAHFSARARLLLALLVLARRAVRAAELPLRRLLLRGLRLRREVVRAAALRRLHRRAVHHDAARRLRLLRRVLREHARRLVRALEPLEPRRRARVVSRRVLHHSVVREQQVRVQRAADETAVEEDEGADRRDRVPASCSAMLDTPLFARSSTSHASQASYSGNKTCVLLQSTRPGACARERGVHGAPHVRRHTCCERAGSAPATPAEVVCALPHRARPHARCAVEYQD
jgi:hypothetical protein